LKSKQHLHRLKFTRVDNLSTFRALRILLVSLLVLVLADLILSQFHGSWANWFDYHYLAICAGLPLLVLSMLRFTYFSYDDSYEILHIHSRSLLATGFRGIGQVRYEFPKRKVVDFTIREGFLNRKLVLTLETEGGQKTKQIRTVDMTLLPRSAVNRVVRSLKRITRQNALMPEAGR